MWSRIRRPPARCRSWRSTRPWELRMPAELVAQYTFLSWIRRGIGTALGASADDPARAGVTIGATFDSSVPAVGAATPSITLDFYGPQDVAGLDGRAVTRVWPMPGATRASPHGH